MIASTLVAVSCTGVEPSPVVNELQPPVGYGPVPFPADNQPTAERIELGRRLFFDTALSADSTISCASCHDPVFAFADVRRVPVGVFGRTGKRNAPSLVNSAYLPFLLREGGVPTLEMQVLVPVQEHDEMDMNMLDVVDRLKQNVYYAEHSRRAYSRELDAFVITRALATFERSMLSSGSIYDQYAASNDRSVLSGQEQRGLELFVSSRTQCNTCHEPPVFSTHDFANNGLYTQYDDPGRERLTGNDEDVGVFRIPSLRNVAITAPYMHDGSVANLTDVLAHYNRGGFSHRNKSPLVGPLNLTQQEMDDIVAFLKTLTDRKFESTID